MWIVASLLLAVAFTADAQQAKVARIGLLGVGSADQAPLFAVFRQSLREQGWIEGQNVTFEDRSMLQDYKRLPEAAAELVRLRVDVILATSTTAARAAQKVTGTIPIVTMVGADPAETRLVASLARPGGNVTGLANLGRELMGKRLELLRETLPAISRIAVLWNSETSNGVLSLKDAEMAAPSLGFRVQSVEARRAEDLEKAFANIVRERSEVVVPVASNLFRAHRVRIVELAAKHRLLGIFDAKAYVEAGGLMSYGSDTKGIFRGLAGYVDRILRGAKPGDLPIEQPTRLELVINLKTAKALGLVIPPAVLARADEIIQ